MDDSPSISSKKMDLPQAPPTTSIPRFTPENEQMEIEDEGYSDTLPTQMEIWDHFTPYTDNNGKTRANCKYCDKVYDVDASNNVTSAMNNHRKACNNHPHNAYVADNQAIASSCRSVTEDSSEFSSHWKFDQEATRKALARMVIIDKLPFKFVEKEGFRQFVSVACPQFIVPSRTTIIEDCYRLYFDEKIKLKTYFKTTGQRISLTVDTWNSSQRLTYMCLTAHYINTDWKMQKVILNFIPCPTHKGDEVGLLIEKCLLDWGVDKIFTITVDNASSNDTIVAYMRRKFVNRGTAILGGKFLHMRCVVHIVNLIVKDCLKELNESVERVRAVVRYVQQSLDRLKKFNDFVVEEKVESKRSLCLDDPTRWDSIYTMLETAVIFQGVFERYEISDADFRGDFIHDGPYGKIGLPTKYDWVVVERFVKVLKYFYKFTVRISGSSYVTSNTFLDEISDVDDMLKEWLTSDDDILVDLARHIKVKFDKYWGDVEKMNMMLYVAVMLDPCVKFSYVEYVLKTMYGPERGEQMGNLAKSVLYDVFEEYKKLYSSTISRSSCTTPRELGDHDLTGTMVIRERRKKKFRQMISEIRGMDESELDIYLREQIVNDSPPFDIIDWWKSHSPKFPILSRLARDVLAMPISSVATEFAFNIGGHIIDNFLASLTPNMAQALICCQDWLHHTPIKPMEEDRDFIQKIEKDIVSSVGSKSNIIGL